MERKPDTDRIPPWVIAPVVLLGVVILFGLIYLMTADNDANTNISVNTSARRGEPAPERTVDRTSTTVYSDTTTPSTTAPAGGSQSVTVPGSQPPPAERGTVLINAKVATRNGSPQAVRNTRFYLLDKDVETILSDANVEPIEGQTLANSLGMAISAPGQYPDFYREALSALKEHIKYTGTTDITGRAQLGSVKPDSYYLFGVARAENGFAMWNSTVSVTTGENLMNLTPQPITEMPSATG